MTTRDRTVRVTGLVMSRTVAFVFALIYVLQSATILYLLNERQEDDKLIHYQRSRINYLEEKLKVLRIIEDAQTGMTPWEMGRLANAVYDQSRKYGFDPLLVLALIQVESSFQKEVVSNKGAMGLMQLKPWVGSDVAIRRGFDWYNRSMLFEPDYNVEIACAYLFELVLEFGDVGDAITAYNIGESRLRSILSKNGNPPHVYLDKVLSRYRELKETYDA